MRGDEWSAYQTLNAKAHSNNHFTALGGKHSPKNNNNNNELTSYTGEL